MNKFFVSAAAGIALSACAQPGVDGRVAGCAEANTHCVQVSVTGSGSGLRIAVDRDELHVRGPSHVIFWRIDNASGQNYTFATNGISFKTAEGKAQFSCVRQQPMVFRCLDPNTRQGKFDYGVTLEGSPTVRPLDPSVINE